MDDASYPLETKTCTKCRVEKSIHAFHRQNRDGKNSPKAACRTCENRAREERRRRSGSDHGERSRQYYAKIKVMRQRDENVARWILADSRCSDRRHGLPNDLTKEVIESLIAAGCLYCGETALRMTLDRIDNSKGHTLDNVNPACIRCNYLRRHLPYES